MKFLSRFRVTMLLATACLILSPTALMASQTKITQSTDTKGASHQSVYSIVGNPIGKKDNFTVNSNTEKTVDITCAVINSGKTPAKIGIWLSPNNLEPDTVLNLKAGTKAKPSQATKTIRLPLIHHWWCRIYAPKTKLSDWKFCAYFSVGDETISQTNPFSAWNTTIRSRETTYHCQINKKNKHLSFFGQANAPKTQSASSSKIETDTDSNSDLDTDANTTNENEEQED